MDLVVKALLASVDELVLRLLESCREEILLAAAERVGRMKLQLTRNVICQGSLDHADERISPSFWVLEELGDYVDVHAFKHAEDGVAREAGCCCRPINQIAHWVIFGGHQPLGLP